MRLEDDLGVKPLFRSEGGVVRLLGSRCTGCGTIAFPPRAICLECGKHHDSAVLSGRGTLHSFTVLENPPAGFSDGYSYGCIDLAEGPRVLAALAGDRFTIGQQVEVVEAPVRDALEGFRFGASDA
jgi:uncharacterized OB-fold protein